MMYLQCLNHGQTHLQAYKLFSTIFGSTCTLHKRNKISARSDFATFVIHGTSHFFLSENDMSHRIEVNQFVDTVRLMHCDGIAIISNNYDFIGLGPEFIGYGMRSISYASTLGGAFLGWVAPRTTQVRMILQVYLLAQHGNSQPSKRQVLPSCMSCI